MARLELRLFIRATPERVWQIISDLDGQERWMVDARRFAVTSEQRSGVGAVIEMTSDVLGLPLLHDVLEVTRWEPPRELAVLHRGQFSGTAAFRLEPVPGGTVFVWLEAFRPPLGPLGELAFRLVVSARLRRVFGRSMQNVRRLAEVSAG